MSDRSSLTEARFLDAGGRRLFVLDIRPVGPCRGAVLYVPPFAEEMNRLRSHAVQLARRLAAEGWRCLLPDLTGTGESDGDFTAADWQGWVDDVRMAGRWLAQEAAGPLTLWGMRTGALLAAEALQGEQALPASRLLLWQPVLDGKLFLTQYLRLRIAAQVVTDAERETTEQIRARLSAGEVVEVAGYALTGRLADGLATRRLSDLCPPPGCPVLWLEVVAQPDQPLPPVSQRLVDAWRAKGLPVAAAGVACPMVWQVHRRADAPELLDATLKLLQEAA